MSRLPTSESWAESSAFVYLLAGPYLTNQGSGANVDGR